MNKKALIEKMSGVMSAINRILPKDPDKIVFYSNMGFRDNVKAVYDELISHDCGTYQIVCAVSDWEDFENRPHPDNVRFVSPTAGVRHFFFGKYFFYSFGKYYVNDKVPYDLEEMPKDLYIQKRKLAKLYVSQRTTVRKMYHMLPYEYWQKTTIQK